MKRYMENIIPATFVLLVIIVFALLAGQKVYGQSVEQARAEQREAMESTYISDVKAVLTESGFNNSGVNMTKATNESGEWEYTVTIYNRSFEWMEAEAKEEMQIELTDMGNTSLGKISLTLLAR